MNLYLSPVLRTIVVDDVRIVSGYLFTDGWEKVVVTATADEDIPGGIYEPWSMDLGEIARAKLTNGRAVIVVCGCVRTELVADGSEVERVVLVIQDA